MRKLGFILLIALSTSSAFAEYRVYQYYVRPKIQNITSPGAQLVTSTMDPRTYTAYHGGKASVEVNLLRSWMCMGDTSKKSICTISEGQELSEGGID